MRQIQKMKKLIIGIFLSISAMPAMAAQISGTIHDEQNDPLAGASVVIMGTTTGTITDTNGNYTLSNVADDATLEFSFLGCTPRQFSSSNVPDVIELNCQTQLEEVVVTASNIGQPCGQSVLPANATAGTWQKDSNDKTICVVSECATGYKVNKKTNTCFKSEPCSNLQILAKIGAKTGHTDIDETGNITCIIDECDPGYEKTKDNKCESISDKPCPKSDLPKHAKEGMRGLDASKNEVCFVTKCADKYVPSDNGTECVLSEGECSAAELQQIANATKGEKLKGVCKATECKEDYKVKNGKCVSKNGDECTASDANAAKAKYKNINNKLQCVITQCKSGYMPNDNGTKCEVSEGPCKPDQVKAIEHATKGELKKGVCHATECENGYEPAGGKCTAIGGKCSNMPKNAKTAHREYDATAGAEVCIVDACDDGCRRSDDKKSCNCPKLSEEDSQKKIDELKDNAQAMKDKEQSLTARLTSGAAIGGMGIGGMQALSAVAEQKADQSAEQDMSAYLATFRCDFGQGRNIKGGDKQIELPGANALFQLNQEYKSLAADLKVRKESLELRPGIEAEHIDDKATTGLYDDVSLGRTDGAFTSLARALSDEASDDAAQWAAQKADTKNKLKTGAIVAGVGAAVGIAGNIAVEATSPKNQSAAIKAKYDALKKLQSDVSKLPNAETGAKCPSNATGTYPNCTCNDTSMVHATVSNTCEPCPDGETAQNGKCVAVVAAGVTPQCDATDPNMQVDAKTGKCTCQNDWLETKDKKNCECPSETHVVVGNKCVKKQTGILDNLGDVASKLADDQNITLPSIELPAQQQPEKIELSSKQLFALGSANLTPEAKNTLTTFATTVKSKTEGNESYCISVTGHTDRTGSQKRNQQLSHQRATAVKDQLVSVGLPEGKITAGGRASSECQSDGPQESCRKVEIEVSSNKCPA